MSFLQMRRGSLSAGSDECEEDVQAAVGNGESIAGIWE